MREHPARRCGPTPIQEVADGDSSTGPSSRAVRGLLAARAAPNLEVPDPGLIRDARPSPRNLEQGMPWAGALPPTPPMIPPAPTNAD